MANQYSADIQTLLQLYRAASTGVSKAESGGSAPIGPDTISCTQLSCNNTVLGSQMQVSPPPLPRTMNPPFPFSLNCDKRASSSCSWGG